MERQPHPNNPKSVMESCSEHLPDLAYAQPHHSQPLGYTLPPTPYPLLFLISSVSAGTT